MLVDDLSARDSEAMREDDVLVRLGSSMKGLTDAQAAERRPRFGFNELHEKTDSPWLKLARQFVGPIPFMIELAVVLSAYLGKWPDFFVILAMLLANSFISFWREYKAEKAIEKLREKAAPTARVLRNGVWTVVAARLLVPGDIIRTRIGDILPADVRLLDEGVLLVDQSMVTGESLPVERHGGQAAFAGTHVTRGESTAVVVCTGVRTVIGNTARQIQDTQKYGHLQKAILDIGKNLMLFAAVVVGFVFILLLFKNESPTDALQFCVVLLVASIPVALPAVLTVTLAIGAINLASEGIIVRRLSTVEELASMDVLCADKTGTLTENRLNVERVEASAGFTAEDVVLYAALCSKQEDNDPIDTAILRHAESLGLKERMAAHLATHYEPFDPKTKKAQVRLRGPNGPIVVLKGAPQTVSALAARGKDSMVLEATSRYARLGMRSLGVALDDGRGWKMVGVLALSDQLRPDAVATVDELSHLGTSLKMITGDNRQVASQIAGQLHLNGGLVVADQIDGDPETNRKLVQNAGVFAEVFPETKLAIVQSLQAQGHIVGMTGDGVNDATALKAADVGIAVHGATDVARSAADLILTNNGLSVITVGIKESRRIFERMYAYALYRIAETIRVLLFLSSAVLVFGWEPVTAIMLVLLAVLNDAAILAVSYDKTIEPAKPVQWDMRVLLSMGVILGVYGLVSSFFLLWLGTVWLHLDHATLQTLIYLKLSVAGHLMIFHARTRKMFWKPLPSKQLFLATFATQIIATSIAVSGVFLKAISWELAAFIWLYSLAFFLAFEPIKATVYRKLGYSEL